MQRLFIVWIWLFSISMWAQSPLVSNDSLAQKQWVDSIYNAMTLKQKVVQIFMFQKLVEQQLEMQSSSGQVVMMLEVLMSLLQLRLIQHLLTID